MRYLLLIVLLIGCNPVKHVLRDQEKFEQVAKEVIRSGMCANDTTFIVKSDTIIDVDTLVEVKTDIEVETINDTTYVTKWKTNTITKTLTIHDTLKSYIVDNARIRLLQTDNIQLNNLVNEYKSKADSRLNWLISLLVLIALFIYLKLRK